MTGTSPLSTPNMTGTSPLSTLVNSALPNISNAKFTRCDASQYVAVLTHLPEGVGMNVSKLQKSYRIKLVFIYLCSVRMEF